MTPALLAGAYVVGATIAYGWLREAVFTGQFDAPFAAWMAAWWPLSVPIMGFVERGWSLPDWIDAPFHPFVRLGRWLAGKR